MQAAQRHPTVDPRRGVVGGQRDRPLGGDQSLLGSLHLPMDDRLQVPHLEAIRMRFEGRCGGPGGFVETPGPDERTTPLKGCGRRCHRRLPCHLGPYNRSPDSDIMPHVRRTP